MKTLLFVCFMINSFSVVLAEGPNAREISKKIEEITAEIKKINELKNKTSEPDIYNDYLKKMESELEQYRALEKTALKEKPRKREFKDPQAKRIYPKAVSSQLNKLEDYRTTTLPLDKKYELLTREYANTMQLVNKLKALAGNSAEQNKTSL